MHGRVSPELYLHDDVGQQVSHLLHTVFTIIDAFVGHPDGPAQQTISVLRWRLFLNSGAYVAQPTT